MELKYISKHIKEYWVYFVYALLTFLCIYVCFGNLDVDLVQHWDEARHGVNAYEMMKEGNYIVNTYNYENDYYNLKPPLSYWGIILGFKLFGTNVFGMRFYSALSMLLTFLVIAVYMHRKAGKTAAVSSMLFFLTFKDLFFEHCARNADADAIYILLFTIGCLCLIESVKNIKLLYVCGFMFALCFLAKSWHACVLLPIGGLFIIFSGLLKRMKIKDYVIFFGTAFVPILLWVIIRYFYDGMDFLGQMFGVDVTERVTWPVSANEDGMFYIKYILQTDAGRLMLGAILLAGVYILLKSKKEKIVISPECLVVVLWVLITLVTFSVTRADNYWYIFPLYPGLCIGAAFLLQKVVDITKDSKSRILVNTAFVIGAGIVFYSAVTTVIGIKDLEESGYQLDIERALEAHQELHGLKMFVEKSNNEYKESYYWEQSGILMAELSGDMKCEEGGVEAYLETEENAVIILDEHFYEKYRQELAEDEVVYRNEYIVLKNFSE